LLSIFTLVTASTRRVDGAPSPRYGSTPHHDPYFSGALVIAGLFTLVPGQVMHTVVFGH
jgi:uncharacterized membrane protein